MSRATKNQQHAKHSSLCLKCGVEWVRCRLGLRLDPVIKCHKSIGCGRGIANLYTHLCRPARSGRETTDRYANRRRTLSAEGVIASNGLSLLGAKCTCEVLMNAKAQQKSKVLNSDTMEITDLRDENTYPPQKSSN